jgi:hypothetical protein
MLNGLFSNLILSNLVDFCLAYARLGYVGSSFIVFLQKCETNTILLSNINHVQDNFIFWQ